MDTKTKAKVRDIIEKSIRHFFENREVKTEHILDKLFPKERRIMSLIHGLQTSMGTTVWEPIATVLAKENGFEIRKPVLFMPNPFELESTVGKLCGLRSRKESLPMSECVNQLKEAAENININEITFEKPPSGKGVDLYLVKDDIEYLFDVKTNQINDRGGPVETPYHIKA